MFKEIVGFLTGNVIKDVGAVIDGLSTSQEEKDAAKLKLAELQLQHAALIETRLNQEIKSKESIIVAEMQQSDSFTKRARPTIVYAGLAFIFLNYVFLPFIYSIAEMAGEKVPTISMELPEQFWVVWGGICSVWMIGRTLEKTGADLSMPWNKK